MTLFMLVMMLVMEKDYDILGHLGGAIFGFLFGLAMYPRPRTDGCRKARLLGLISLASLSVLLLGLLFGLHKE